jgi:butyrate response factor 1
MGFPPNFGQLNMDMNFLDFMSALPPVPTFNLTAADLSAMQSSLFLPQTTEDLHLTSSATSASALTTQTNSLSVSEVDSKTVTLPSASPNLAKAKSNPVLALAGSSVQGGLIFTEHIDADIDADNEETQTDDQQEEDGLTTTSTPTSTSASPIDSLQSTQPSLLFSTASSSAATDATLPTTSKLDQATTLSDHPITAAGAAAAAYASQRLQSKKKKPSRRSKDGRHKRDKKEGRVDHSTHRMLKIKELYKTEMCSNFINTGVCDKGDECTFAHGDDELRNRDRHEKYKTEMCRNFHEEGNCRFGHRCDFIH